MLFRARRISSDADSHMGSGVPRRQSGASHGARFDGRGIARRMPQNRQDVESSGEPEGTMTLASLRKGCHKKILLFTTAGYLIHAGITLDRLTDLESIVAGTLAFFEGILNLTESEKDLRESIRAEILGLKSELVTESEKENHHVV